MEKHLSRKEIHVLKGLWALLLISCVTDSSFNSPIDCEQRIESNISLSDFKALYQGETKKIVEELIIEAYVISSDHHGNFYGSLYVQDRPQNPRDGLEILFDFPDAHLFYPPGKKVILNAKGLYLGESQGILRIGGVYELFGQQIVGRIPGNLVKNHLILDCGEHAEVRPKRVALEHLGKEMTGTLVSLDSLQFIEEQLGTTFADHEQESIRKLEDCNGNAINLQTSGYADFYDMLLPEGKGEITAVFVSDKAGFSLRVRGPEDIQFTAKRCAKGPPPVSSDQVLISEIADPDNNSKARFIELYNAGEEVLELNGWVLERYTNDNLVLGSAIDLSGLKIEPKQVITLASDALVFEEVYGFQPAGEGGLNSAADSNGDDNILLRDPFGEVIDIFGRIGEDGSGTDHEFEDGRALRLEDISKGNPVYDPAQWLLYNDTGNAGTIKQPQIAPQDFTPGQH